VTSNFYATLAQVLPLLLLALIWDSDYLVRLRGQRRQPRRSDPAGVWFWTKPRVRVYTLGVAGIVIASISVVILVLAGLVPDSRALRIILTAGVLLVLATLLTHISVDVVQSTSTRERPGPDAQPAAPPEPAAPPVPAEPEAPVQPDA
jgi:hypothetical protein